ncbi:YczE/YyaS/YitT family protein [Lentzea jiangxiensis]|uniref:Uncharacterized membrane protein YczE n=1 Tax=Lentzea jiangxiensis TaxID=641025 RepID=A0A1H0X4V8_9PSEU|nr:hypothetical protein [Lentzea jiangxiensis]SDP97859.1 Uncharacterized membrane protein YczE [Lentzea jiangxiensis]
MPGDTTRNVPTSRPDSAGWPLPVRLAQVATGTALMGFAVALLVNAATGLLPLDILHRAIGNQFGWTLGGAIIAVQSSLLVLNLSLGVKPGIGTLAAVIIPAVTADLALSMLHPPQLTWLRLMALLLGGAMFAVGTALYLSAEMGALPRDGLINAIAQRTNWNWARIRIAADVLCLLAGVLIFRPALAVANGSLGIGSLLLALTLGPSIASLVALFSHRPRPDTPAREEA